MAFQATQLNRPDPARIRALAIECRLGESRTIPDKPRMRRFICEELLMPENERIIGFADDQLAKTELNWRPGLFDGQVVLVSGGGTGLGKAIAYQFGRLGAKLVICGRRRDPLEAAAEGMRKIGIDCLVHPMNIRDPEQVAALFDTTWTHYGHLDILINNAGGQYPQPAIDFSVKGWNAVIDTNLNGTWYMMQAAARRWRDAARSGCIVNIVAVVERGMPGIAHSCAARAGVIYLGRTLALEWAPLGIRVNSVAPWCYCHRGNECVLAGNLERVPTGQPDDEVRRRAGRRRRLLLLRRSERQIHHRRAPRDRRGIPDVGRAMDRRAPRLLQAQEVGRGH